MNATDVTASMVQTLFQTAAKQSASVSLDGRAQYPTARWGGCGAAYCRLYVPTMWPEP